MATANQVMTKAISFLGLKEYPADSNNVVFNTDYYGHPVSGSWYPWCCTYVWDIYRLAEASDLFYNGEKVAYCPYVYNWGKVNKLNVSISEGRYGDIVLFDWNHDGEADHIGFIERKNADGTYTTIEGNTSVGNDSNGGEVMRRVRNQSTICMIIRPKYKEVEEVTFSYETFKEYMNQYIEEVAEQGCAEGFQTMVRDWAMSAKLTDGNQPQSDIKRWQVWTMFYRFGQFLGVVDKDD